MWTRATIFLLAALIVSPVWSPEPGKTSPKEIENLLGMRFVWIPSGEFMMGSDESPEALAKAYPQYGRERFVELVDEAPVHKVHITRPFYLGQHEVTVGQFRRFVEASGYQPESEADGTGGYGYNPDYDPEKSERGDAFEGRNPKYSWRNPGFKQGDDHPVVNVTWNDAVAMSKWLSEKEGRKYRLPTEANGNMLPRRHPDALSQRQRPTILVEGREHLRRRYDDELAAVERLCACGGRWLQVHGPGGSFAPNALGLYDMHGNVWEWCADWYDDHYYAQSPGYDPLGPASGKVRVRRGGSWHTWSFYAGRHTATGILRIRATRWSACVCYAKLIDKDER